MLTKVMAVCLEAVGMCIGVAGIIVEVSYKADFGFLMITSGAVIAAFGGMIFAKLVRGGKL